MADGALNLGMRFITRIDHSRTHAWWVRFQQHGVLWMFSDGKFGGRAKAKVAAKAFRDQQAKALGVTGEKQRTAPGHGYVKLSTVRGRRAYVGWVKLDNAGGVSRTQWLIDVWGKRAAKQGCEAWLTGKQKEIASGNG